MNIKMTDPVDVHDINFTPIVLGQEEYSPLKKANNEEVKIEMLEGVDLIVSKEIYSNTLTCGICTEFLMPEKVPHFCSTCQRVLFCRTCIYEWLGKKNEQNESMNECPACRKQSPKFLNALNDEKVKTMLEGIQLYCENKPFGCKEILTYFTFADHICGACPFCNQSGLLQSQLKDHYSSGCDGYQYECPFCHLNGTRDQILRHRCYQMFDGTSANKFQITVSRITNKDSFKQNKQNIQCKVCKNLLRYYKVCGSCKADVCWKCTELKNSETQCCKVRVQNFQPPLKMIMSTIIENIRISCQGCQKEFSYDEFNKHSLECGKCSLCKEILSKQQNMANHIVIKCPHFIICCYDCQANLPRDAFPTHDCEQQKQLTKERDELTKRQQEQRVKKEEERIIKDKKRQEDKERLNEQRLRGYWILRVIITWIFKDLFVTILPFLFFFHSDYQYASRVSNEMQDLENSAKFENCKMIFLYCTIVSYLFSSTMAIFAAFYKVVDIYQAGLHILSQNGLIYIHRYCKSMTKIYILEVLNFLFRTILTIALSIIAIKAMSARDAPYFLATIIPLFMVLFTLCCMVALPKCRRDILNCY